MTWRRWRSERTDHRMTRRFFLTVVILDKLVPDAGLSPQNRVQEPVEKEVLDVSLIQHLDRSLANVYSRRASNAVPEMRCVRPRIIRTP